MASGAPYGQQTVRTIKNGTLKIKDASSEITCTFMDGGLSGQMKNRSIDIIRHRGAIQQFIEVDDEPLELSFSMHLQEFYGDASTTGESATLAFLTPFEAAFGSNNDVHTITSTETTLTGEPDVLTLELTINDPAGNGTEVLTFAKCIFPTIQMEEGYPDRYSVTASCRGGLTIVYTASS